MLSSPVLIFPVHAVKNNIENKNKRNVYLLPK
ncbi:uncharacterized protein METZ01_LOCUS229230 [marine metagenome]|uniref:Uncharacterized protein n=1 Tax=marine metagenome TaxID=408172 RepID=A0A382GMM9_9ZZZZ